MDQLFQVVAMVEKVTTIGGNGMVRVIFDTKENLTSIEKMTVMGWHNDKPGWLLFLQEKPAQPEDVLIIPPLPKDKSRKTSAERLRASIWVWGKQRGLTNNDDQEAFYEQTMNNLINQVKEKLT